MPDTQNSSSGRATARPKSKTPKLVMGAVQGHIELPAHVVKGAARLADEFYTAQEEHDWGGDQVETYAEPLWLLGAGATWCPDPAHLGLAPTGRHGELVVTAGVDPHTDDFHGLVLVVVLHNDGLKFKQGRLSYAPLPGDWFIFNDRVDHSVSSKKGRSTFVGWTIPLQPL